MNKTLPLFPRRLAITLATLALAPLSSADSLHSALAHGVSTADYAEAISLWTQAKTVLPCRRTGVSLAESFRGFRESEFTLDSDAEVIVTYVYDGGAKRSSLGWYDAASPGVKRIIWRDASTGPEAPLAQGSKASLGILPMGTRLRFFVRFDGARGGLVDLHQDPALNAGQLNHVAARLFPENTGPLFVAFEDKPGGGDADFNDLVIRVQIVPVAGPKLHRVNTASGKTSFVAQLPVAGNYDNLVADPVSGDLLLMADNAARIHHVNPFTGKIVDTEKTGTLRRHVRRTAVSVLHQAAYATDAATGGIVKLDLAGIAPAATIASLPAGWIPGDLVYDEAADRLLVYAERNASVRLFSVAAPGASNPVVSELCGLPRKASGLAFDGNGRLLAFNPANGVVYTINPATGAVSSLGESGIGAIAADLTSAGQNPGPGADKMPVQLGSSGADVVTQYNNVVPGKAGIRSTVALPTILRNEGLNSAACETFHELFYVPVNASSLQFKMLGDRGSFKFHFALFDYAAVDGLAPESLAYRVAAAKAAVPIFDDRLHDPGDVIDIDVAAKGLAGKVVGFFIIPNNTIDKFLSNPHRYSGKGNSDNTKRQPLFSISAANPGKLDQVMSFSNGTTKTVFSFEDLSRFNGNGEGGWNSDNSFADLVFSVTPALKPVGSPVEMFLLEPDVRNRQTTADPHVDWDAALAAIGSIEPVNMQANVTLGDAYLHATALRIPAGSAARLVWADPARPNESVVLFSNCGRSAGKSTGIGHLAAGSKLRFRLTHDGAVKSTDSEETASGSMPISAGRVPGTDTVLLWVGENPATAPYLFGISFEAWSLRHSGDVRNLLGQSDGVTCRQFHCY